MRAVTLLLSLLFAASAHAGDIFIRFTKGGSAINLYPKVEGIKRVIISDRLEADLLRNLAKCPKGFEPIIMTVYVDGEAVTADVLKDITKENVEHQLEEIVSRAGLLMDAFWLRLLEDKA